MILFKLNFSPYRPCLTVSWGLGLQHRDLRGRHGSVHNISPFDIQIDFSSDKEQSL